MPPAPASNPTLPRPASIAAAARDARWLAHRYDPEHDAVHLLPVPRAVHGQATFLTDEYLPHGLDPLIVRRADAIQARPVTAPLHFVFHSAFCCSTLVARAFDDPGRAMSLKEPVVLNDIVGWRRRGGQGPDMASVLDDVLTLLARPFGAGEAIVAKPSNIVNGLAAAILALRPGAQAILLHAPLPTFLASIAKKGIDGRLWARTLLLGLLDDGLVDLGFEPRDHLGQTDLQVAAVGWLAQQALFARLVERFGGARVRTLDSATLMADPAAAIGAISAHFGMPLDQAGRERLAGGPAFTTHSKLGTAFGARDRDAEATAAGDLHRDEIDKVAHWAAIVARSAGIAIDPPSSLLGEPRP